MEVVAGVSDPRDPQVGAKEAANARLRSASDDREDRASSSRAHESHRYLGRSHRGRVGQITGTAGPRPRLTLLLSMSKR